MHLFLNISDLLIDFDTRYPEYIRQRCARYLVEPGPDGPAAGREADFCIRASEEDIERANVDNVGLMEAELYAMSIPLSEAMPAIGRMMTHGVALTYEGRSYIFTAESGVGKSTHAFLWQKYLGADKVHIINGDKPILRFCEDGAILAYGSPWSGKEHLDENVSAPLGGICLLRRLGDEPEAASNAAAGETDPAGPRIYRATREESLDFLMHQIYIPHNPAGQLRTLQLLEQLYERVPIYHLVTDISREGVLTSFEKFVEAPANRVCVPAAEMA